MSGIVKCSECVFCGKARDRSSAVCRKRAPSALPALSAPTAGYIPATWPGVDPEQDGCGEGAKA